MEARHTPVLCYLIGLKIDRAPWSRWSADISRACAALTKMNCYESNDLEVVPNIPVLNLDALSNSRCRGNRNSELDMFDTDCLTHRMSERTFYLSHT